MEDPEEYYDVDDGYDDDDRADEQSNKKVAYPPRLMVDFTSLGMNALLRYAQFYQITVRDDYDKDELAAVVARHFDCTLEVEEDESIVSFMQRIRNGEKSVVRHRPPEKDRSKHADKKRKKSNSNNSRKRQRDAPSSGASSGAAGKDAGGASATGADSKSSSAAVAHDDDQPPPPPPSSRPPARSKPSGPPSSGSNHHGGSNSHDKSSSSNGGSGGGSSSSSKSSNSHKKSSDSKKTKDNDNGEDNELYCICNLPSYGNMIACDGKKCPNPSQWYHLECVGFSDGRHPDTWLCPECDPKGFADFKSKKKKSKQRSKSPGSK